MNKNKSFWDSLTGWITDVRSVATGEKSPTVNIAVEQSTIVGLALGIFSAIAFALIIKESIAFFFRSLEK